jgi:hypothetical protein
VRAAQRLDGEGSFAAVGEARRADRGHRPRAPALGQFERHPAAQRVARDVRPLPAEVVQERGDGVGQLQRVGRRVVGQRRRVAEAGQVDPDDLSLGRQPIDDGLPDLVVRSEPVDEQQRLAAADPDVVEPHAAAG